MHGTLSRLPGSRRRFKLTPEFLAILEEQMRVDDETTATLLVKIVNSVGYDVFISTIVRAWKILGWTFHGSRYCQMIRAQNKEKRMEWACKNLHKNFKNIIWTDESMIHSLISYSFIFIDSLIHDSFYSASSCLVTGALATPYLFCCTTHLA